jgi:glycosyltransferase involved in cell wall biosynthesis
MICKYFFLLENYILKKSNHVITISEQFKKILVKDKINAKKISVINNWAPNKIKSIKTIKLKKKLIKIMYTGTLAFKHDPDFIFEIIKRFSDIAEFDFFCSGTGADILRLKQKQNKLKNLNLFPLISDKNYSKVLSTADFCLATLDVKTKNEFAVPSKVYSYIAALKPIIFIGPKNNSQFKIINKYNLGLAIKSKNIKLIKKIFIKFYKKKQNLIKINNNLKKYKKTNFEIKKISKKFTHILK